MIVFLLRLRSYKSVSLSPKKLRQCLAMQAQAFLDLPDLWSKYKLKCIAEVLQEPQERIN